MAGVNREWIISQVRPIRREFAHAPGWRRIEQGVSVFVRARRAFLVFCDGWACERTCDGEDREQWPFPVPHHVWHCFSFPVFEVLQFERPLQIRALLYSLANKLWIRIRAFHHRGMHAAIAIQSNCGPHLGQRDEGHGPGIVDLREASNELMGELLLW